MVENANVTFPTGTSVALLGRNGAGKSTLLQLIAGTQAPDRGRVVSTGSISWPVGFAGSFHPELTGAQNVRFIARVYRVDTKSLVNFVREFAEVGRHFDLPLRAYSSGMKSRLSFGVSMGIRFDTYLVDEVTAVGDAAFKTKSNRVFLDRMERSSSIVVSHSMNMIKRLCDAGAVLEGGVLTYYDDVNDAIRHHSRNIERAKRQSSLTENP